MKSKRRRAINQVREGKQDMYSDVEAGCLAPDRISNRTPLMSRPAAVRAVIGHGALAPQCQLGFLDNGFRCALPAVAYVEFHMVGHCQRFDCDAHGNACGFVCADHLDALEYTAQCTAAEMQPTALRAAVQSCRSMPDVWQNASERIRHPASRGGTLMPNTWATASIRAASLRLTPRDHLARSLSQRPPTTQRSLR